MRQRDLEILDSHLKPIHAAQDRVDEAVRVNVSGIIALRDQVRDLQRNEEIHKTEIAQGLASIRSLLTRANRAAREQGIVEDDSPIDEITQMPNVELGNDVRIKRARTANPGRTVL